MTKFYYILLILLLHVFVNAQNHQINVYSGVEKEIESDLNSLESGFHTSLKPYNRNDVLEVLDIDELYSRFYLKSDRYSYRKLRTENFIEISKPKYSLNFNPVINLGYGFSRVDSVRIYNSAFGLKVQGDIGSKLSFYGDVINNKSSFMPHVETYIEKYSIVPGQGLAIKGWKGYHYNNASYYAKYDLSKYIYAESGFGKHHWGEGYRSLFLSYNSYNYPYLKLSTNIWKVKYLCLFTSFRDITNYLEDDSKPFDKKYGTFHYLSLNIGKRLNLGLFEGVIWSNRNYDLHYLNPIIFYRPVEFSLGSPDNAMLGMSLKYKIGRKSIFYGQTLLDDFNMPHIRAHAKHLLNPDDAEILWGAWDNKYAFQFGLKTYDVFRNENLDLQAEYNIVRPFTYSHRNVSQNIAHFNQPLAHPLGANFKELLLIGSYTYDRWFYELKYTHVLIGLDPTGKHLGQNIYNATYDANDNGNILVPAYYNEIGQGITTKVSSIKGDVTYLFNHKNSLRLNFGFMYRKQKSDVVNNDMIYLFIGIKSSLSKFNYDGM